MPAKQQLKPTRKTAVAVLDILCHGLVRGLGNRKPGEFCVEAAVCYAMGLPHSDEPPCVSKVVRSFKIALNDSAWSSNEARAQGLRRLAVAQLGSNEIDESIFAKELALSVVRKIVPIALRAAGAVVPGHKDALEKASVACEVASDLSAAASAASAALAASAASSAYSFSSAADSAARSAAYRAAYSATDSATSARSATHSAALAASSAYSFSSAASAYSAADSAARSASYSAYSAYCFYSVYSAADSTTAADSARDSVLSLMAECAVEALIAAKSPGVKWLTLCPV